jgi:hypothetical protein
LFSGVGGYTQSVWVFIIPKQMNVSNLFVQYHFKYVESSNLLTFLVSFMSKYIA